MPLIHAPSDIRVHQPNRIQVDESRLYFERCIKMKEEEEDEEEKPMPRSSIVKYPDLLDKLWGWDRLVSFGHSVSISDYRIYLEAYSRNTKTAAKDLHIADIAETCCRKEEELVRKIREIDYMEKILPMTKSIILSCLIHQCANAVSATGNCTSSAISNVALWCMTKEADLMLELLTRGANPSNDIIIIRSSSIHLCALSLMNCTLHSSAAAAASGAMLGIAKEAERMCKWMRENNELLDYDDCELSEVFMDGNFMRLVTLGLVYDMLQESVAAGFGGGCNNGAGKTYRGSISDILDSQYHNIKDCKRIEKQEKNDHFLGPLWLKLLPRSLFFEWSDYINYLAEYYVQNAVRFLADQNIDEWMLDPPPARAVQIDTTTSSSMAAVVAYHCLRMEEKLVSKWGDRVPRTRIFTFSINTIIESRLITEFALKICGTKGEISDSSAIAFACIAMEADLICELLERGGDPDDHIIEESRAIRMCALGLRNLKGNQSNAFAAAMMGVAKEAKRLSDWMRGVNQLYKFPTSALSEPSELAEGCLIRTRTLNVMTRILCEFSFPSDDWHR